MKKTLSVFLKLSSTKIRMVREGLGSKLEIVVTKGKKIPIGEALKAGANLEVIPSDIWTHKDTDQLLDSLSDS